MICATIASLVVAVSANTSKFSRDLSGAENRVGRFRGMVDKASGALGGFRGALGMIGIGVGVGALVGKFNQIRETLDKAAKSARLLGIEVSDLRGLEFAADITGLGGGKVSPAMQSFSKRLGESFRRGTGPAKEALEDLGLSVEQLIGLPLKEQLLVVADAFQDVDNSTQQAAISANLFSKANMQAGLLLAEGREGIEGLVAEYKRLHGDADSGTDSVETFNDSLTRLQTIVGGKLEQNVVAIAKAVGLVGEAADKAGLQGEGAGGFLGQVLSSSGIGLAVLYGEKLGILSTETDAAAEASQQHRTALQQEMLALDGAADAAEQLAKQTETLARLKGSAETGLKGFGKSLEDQLAVLTGTDPLDLQLRDALNQARPVMQLGEFNKYREGLEALVDELKAAREAEEQYSQATAESAREAAKLAAEEEARQRSLESAAMGYLHSLGVREPVLIGGAAKGSAAAYEAQARAQMRGPDKSPEEKIRIAVEKALEEDRRQTQTLEAIREELAKTKIAQVPP